jgi:hypothetical protein
MSPVGMITFPYGCVKNGLDATIGRVIPKPVLINNNKLNNGILAVILWRVSSLLHFDDANRE